MKINTKTKGYIAQAGRWAVFIMTALTMTIKIAEVSAYQTVELLLKNPELTEYCDLVNNGYLFFF